MDIKNYFENLTFAELKRAITQLNKLVREDLIIKVKGKTHDDLKEEVKAKWDIAVRDILLDTGSKKVGVLSVKLGRPLDKVTKPLAEMAQKREEAKKARAEIAAAKKAEKKPKMDLEKAKKEEAKIMKQAEATLRRVKDKMGKEPPMLTTEEKARKAEFEEKLKLRKGKPNFM